jgi:hypothetical protein
VALAVETGIAPQVWLDDPRAMVTAVEVLEERAAELKRKGRR